MYNLAPQSDYLHGFKADTYSWLTGQRHGHMGKWQYTEAEYKDDLVCGAKLWDQWEQEASQHDNMMRRQNDIVDKQINNIIDLTQPIHNLIDLGPGGRHAVINNTLPFIQGYQDNLKSYIAIDMTEESSVNAKDIIQEQYPHIQSQAIHDDFFNSQLKFPTSGQSLALMMGGTIGNFEAGINTPNSMSLMANRLLQLKRVLPQDTVILIALEATQNAEQLEQHYAHPLHAQMEVNLMHAIKRDVLFEQDGFDPTAWKYVMKWCPASYQFCHILESTALQRFEILGKDIRITKGTQLVTDNSFKFPVLAMQRSAQLAKVKYLEPFADEDGRMVIHAIQL